jgi:hypothetical protein
MKNLLKLAMVDTCRKRHEDKTTLAAQMAIVAELGISLRNVQYSIKNLDELQDLNSGFVKVREIQKEIIISLLTKPQTEEQILAEVSYLIHAPHDLQKRTLRTILRDMVQKHTLSADTENGVTVYRTTQPHVSLFDPTDLASRVSGLLTHIDAFNHTIGKPFYRTYSMSPSQAQGLHKAINEFLHGTGNAYEHDCREEKSVTKPYYFYMGSAPLSNTELRRNLSDAVLEVIQMRFKDPESPSMLRNYWYHLTPASARAVFDELKRFIDREATAASLDEDNPAAVPFTFYIGLAEHHRDHSQEEI